MKALVVDLFARTGVALAVQAAVHSAWIAVGRDGSWVSVVAAVSIGFVGTFAVPSP